MSRRHFCYKFAEQFSSLLALHPEYVLIFHECQHAGVSSSPTNHTTDIHQLQSQSEADPTTRSGQSAVAAQPEVTYNSVLVEAEVSHASLPCATQTTVVVES